MVSFKKKYVFLSFTFLFEQLLYFFFWKYLETIVGLAAAPWPMVGQWLANHWHLIGQPLANHWPAIGQSLSNHWPIIGQQSAIQWPTIDHPLAISQPNAPETATGVYPHSWCLSATGVWPTLGHVICVSLV